MIVGAVGVRRPCHIWRRMDQRDSCKRVLVSARTIREHSSANVAVFAYCGLKDLPKFPRCAACPGCRPRKMFLTTLVGCHSIRPSPISVEPIGNFFTKRKGLPLTPLPFRVLNLTALVAQLHRKVTPMRLTLKFFALLLLLAIVAFPNSGERKASGC
jgi:hypothetical protein